MSLKIKAYILETFSIAGLGTQLIYSLLMCSGYMWLSPQNRMICNCKACIYIT
jgi:hypothetical protein